MLVVQQQHIEYIEAMVDRHLSMVLAQLVVDDEVNELEVSNEVIMVVQVDDDTNLLELELHDSDIMVLLAKLGLLVDDEVLDELLLVKIDDLQHLHFLHGHQLLLLV